MINQLSITCGLCKHHTLLEVANLIAVVGGDTTTHEVRQRARCHNCGVKGNNTIVADKPYLDQPWDDVTCSASAVRKICGNDFVSEENYDQLMLTPQERRPYREALSDARVDAIWRSSQINCSGYTIGNTTRTTCR